MNLQQIAAKANVDQYAVLRRVWEMGVPDPRLHTEVEPIFAECVITSLKPLDITKPTTPRIIRWFLGQK